MVVVFYWVYFFGVVVAALEGIHMNFCSGWRGGWVTNVCQGGRYNVAVFPTLQRGVADALEPR